jgi:hypothetical protein
LSVWRLKEFLLQFASSLSFWRCSPSLERGLEVSDWSRVLD